MAISRTGLFPRISDPVLFREGQTLLATVHRAVTLSHLFSTVLETWIFSPTTIDDLDDEMTRLQSRVALFAGRALETTNPVFLSCNTYLHGLYIYTRYTIAQIRFRQPFLHESQGHLDRAAMLADQVYTFFVQLPARVRAGETTDHLEWQVRDLQEDVCMLTTRIAERGEIPVLTDVLNRLRKFQIYTCSILGAIHHSQSIFVDVGLIQQKCRQLYANVVRNNQFPRTRFVMSSKAHQLCAELRTLFASTGTRIQAVDYSVLVHARTEFDRLYSLYKQFDDQLVLYHILPPLRYSSPPSSQIPRG